MQLQSACSAVRSRLMFFCSRIRLRYRKAARPSIFDQKSFHVIVLPRQRHHTIYFQATIFPFCLFDFCCAIFSADVPSMSFSRWRHHEKNIYIDTWLHLCQFKHMLHQKSFHIRSHIILRSVSLFDNSTPAIRLTNQKSVARNPQKIKRTHRQPWMHKIIRSNDAKVSPNSRLLVHSACEHSMGTSS